MVDFSLRHWLFNALYRLREQESSFYGYVNDFNSLPNYNIIPPDAEAAPPMPRGRPPEIFATVCSIIGWAHWPANVVWDMPAGLARWNAVMAMEAAGVQVDFLDAKALAFFREAEAIKAAAKAAKEAAQAAS